MTTETATRQTELHVTVAAVEEAIEQALAAGNVASGVLRAHITLMLPLARTDIGQLSRADINWYRQAGRLDRIRHSLAEFCGQEPQAAHQVRSLARDAEWLLGVSRPHLPDPRLG